MTRVTAAASAADIEACGLKDYGEAEWMEKVLVADAAAIDAYHPAAEPGGLLLRESHVCSILSELAGRVESAYMVVDKEATLGEIRYIEREARRLEEQPLGRQHEDRLRKVLNRCIELEAACVTYKAQEEIVQLKSKLGDQGRGSGNIRNEESAAERSEETEGPQSRASSYTKNLMRKLRALEVAPVAATMATQSLFRSEEHAEVEFTQFTSSEVSLCSGLPLLTLEQGQYPIGMSLGPTDDHPAVKASRLLNVIPMGTSGDTVDGSFLHHNYTEQLLASIANPGDSMPELNSLPYTHISCNPPALVDVAEVEISKDLVRRSHLIRLSDAYPKVRAVVQRHVDLESQLVHTPLFVNGKHYGHEAHSKDCVQEGATDAEDDPPIEVPYVVAMQIAEAVGARVPSWQEWEAAARGKQGLRFPWGDTADVNCIEVGTKEFKSETTGDGSSLDGVTVVNVLNSFGWLRCTESPCGLVSLPRYGWEWNSVNFDIGDETAGLDQPPATHLLRSMCDLGVAWHPELKGSAHRSFTLPCAASYGVPHKGIHCAAFRLAYPSGTPFKRKTPPSITDLLLLLEVTNDEAGNIFRIKGLLGPPESVTTHSTGLPCEEWWYLTRGISLEVSLVHGCRVRAVRLYDDDTTRSRSLRHYEGCVATNARFPLTTSELPFGDPVRVCGNAMYYAVKAGQWPWCAGTSTRPCHCKERSSERLSAVLHPGKPRPLTTPAHQAVLGPLTRFPPEKLISVCVLHAKGKVISLCASL